MRSKKTKKLIEELALKHNLKISEIEKIIEAPFHLFAQVASEGNKETMDFSSVRIPYWGLFAVKEGRKKFFREYNNKKNNNDKKDN